MNKVTVPIPTTVNELKDLSREELQTRFEALFKSNMDRPDRDKLQSLLHDLQVHQIELEMQNRELSETQQQLEEARDRYADLYDFAPTCYVSFDDKGCIQEINLTGTAMLGQERTRLIGKPFSLWLTKESTKLFFSHLRQTQQGGKVESQELQLRLENGHLVDVRLETVSSNQLLDNKPINRCVIIDITERKLAELEIRDQARQLSLITDAMPVLIAYVDHNERYQFVNRSYEKWFKLPRNEIKGRTVRDLVGEAAYEILEKFIRIVLAGSPVSFEIVIPYLTQGERDISASYIPDFGVDGKVAGYFVSIRDVTEHKKLAAEDRMRLLETAHVARINTMGEMVAEIAHELNQPLAAITIYSDTISRMLSKGDHNQQDIISAAEEIKLQAKRASEVISRLREFVSKKERQLEPININGLIEKVLHLIEVEANWHGVNLTLDLAQTLPVVYVDKILIEQVIFNLTRNAIEAMAEIEDDKRFLIIKTFLGKHNEIELSVEDSGPGMSISEIEQAFMPFHSSKPGGMGMGLSISLSIIKAHQGRLWAIPNESGGTTFSFTIPVITQQT